MDRRPIGIFDSGVGGLTVVKELIRQLPKEDILYFGDTARLPYGTKSKQAVTRFSVENVLFLLRHNVKLVIIACNTSSSTALGVLKKNFSIPIIGVIEPGVKDAIRATRNNRIGVIATSTTVRSESYRRQIIKSSSSARVFSQSCPLFVPLVEEGWLNDNVTLLVIRRYLLALKRKGIDTLILGCTHYPLLKIRIRKVMGKDVALIDSAVSTAKAVKDLLAKEELLNSSSSKGRQRFFVSDEPERFKRMGERFLHRKLSNVRKERV